MPNPLDSMSPEEQQRMASMAASMGLPGAPPTMPGAQPSANGGAAAPTPDQARQAAEMMRNNPEMVKQAAEMMKNMSPEELERLAGMPGAPAGMTPEMMKASVGM